MQITHISSYNFDVGFVAQMKNIVKTAGLVDCTGEQTQSVLMAGHRADLEYCNYSLELDPCKGSQSLSLSELLGNSGAASFDWGWLGGLRPHLQMPSAGFESSFLYF